MGNGGKTVRHDGVLGIGTWKFRRRPQERGHRPESADQIRPPPSRPETNPFVSKAVISKSTEARRRPLVLRILVQQTSRNGVWIHTAPAGGLQRKLSPAVPVSEDLPVGRSTAGEAVPLLPLGFGSVLIPHIHPIGCRTVPAVATTNPRIVITDILSRLAYRRNTGFFHYRLAPSNSV